ncbi:hypothetical protein D3C76_265340 [compost metagenome]
MLDQPVAGKLRALLQHHFGVHGLAPLRVRDADHGGDRHVRVGVERRLDLHRVDVEPAGDDHVLLAVDDEQETLFILVTEVAGLPEAVAELRRGRLRVAVVAGNGGPAAQPDFPGVAGCHFPALLVDDDQLDTHRHAPCRGQAAVLAGRQVIGLAQGGHWLQALGGAVDLQEDVAETLLQPRQFARAHRRGAVVDTAQTRQVVIVGLRQVEKTIEQRGHQRTDGDPLRLDVAAPLHEVRGVLGHRAAAAERCRQHAEAGAVADRRHVQQTRPLIDRLLAFGIEGIATGQPVVHGVLRALAFAGGAAGEAVDEDVRVRIAFHAGVLVGDAFEQAVEAEQSITRFRWRVHAYNGNATRTQAVEIAFQQYVFEEDHFRLDVIHLGEVLFRRVAEVGEGRGRLALQGSPGMQQRQVVVLQDAQVHVAAPQLQAFAHHVDDPVGESVQLDEAVAPAALDIDQRFAVAMANGELGEGAREVHFHPECLIVLVVEPQGVLREPFCGGIPFKRGGAEKKRPIPGDRPKFTRWR